MNEQFNFIQPLIFNNIDEKKICTTHTLCPTDMYISEFSCTKRKLEMTFIPSPCCEWIIAYNTTDSKSMFVCVGASTKLSSVDVSGFDHYFCVHFSDKGCYFNMDNCLPTDILDSIIKYIPKKETYEYTFIQKLQCSNGFDEHVALFLNYLAQSKIYTPIPSAVSAILELIKKSNGCISTLQLAEHTGYSDRHIARLFKTTLGFGPKEYCRYIRFHKVLAEIFKNPNRENSAFIINSGYSDQAHFQREFKEFMGITPKQFIGTITAKNLPSPHC